MDNGQTTINVYSYLGQMKKTNIGRVYAADADDWDIVDKTFSLTSSSHRYFTVATNGIITMEAETPPGTYTLEADVHDNARNENAVGHVTINVYSLPQVAFDNQAAIRISMDTNEYDDPSTFLISKDGKGSPKDEFVALLKHKITSDMVLQNDPIIDVFSIKPSMYDMTIDVRFTVMHGNTYLSKTTVEGIIYYYLDAFEDVIKGRIKAVGIDMCQVTRCDNGCRTVHRADFVSSFNSNICIAF